MEKEQTEQLSSAESQKQVLPAPRIEEIEAEWAVLSCDCDPEWG